MGDFVSKYPAINNIEINGLSKIIPINEKVKSKNRITLIYFEMNLMYKLNLLLKT